MTLVQVTMISVTIASVFLSVFLVILTVLLLQIWGRLKHSFDRLDDVIEQGLITSRAVHDTVRDLMSKIEAAASIFSALGIKRIVQTITDKGKEHHESTK
jgi:hypothetical protein